jgi:hypothetical protein
VNLELCTGAIDDSAYIDIVQILRLQEEFAKNDPTSERSSQTFSTKDIDGFWPHSNKVYSCVCNPLLLRVIGHLKQTMLCIQLALPLFDLGMKGPFAKPS